MESFGAYFPRIYLDSGFKGWFVSSILLAAWFGSLVHGLVADHYGRKRSILIAVVIFTIGSALQAVTVNVGMIFAGRVIAGFPVRMLMMIVPMYISKVWLDYGTHYIGGIRCAPDIPYADGSSTNPTFNPRTDVGPNGCTGQWTPPGECHWRCKLPLPWYSAWGRWRSPSHHASCSCGSEDQALASLSQLRRMHIDNALLHSEFLAIKAEVLFEEDHVRTHYAGKTSLSLMTAQYMTLVSTWPALRRLSIGCLIMFFQQFMGLMR
jgi:hypothetical protein